MTVLGRPAGSVDLRRRVAYVTQDASVYSDLTVRQNVRYFARSPGRAHGDVDRVIEQVGLVDHAETRSDSLSGGQRSRVSLAVALLGSPQLLVLDEPTVGLDPVLRRELWGLFGRAGSVRAVALSSPATSWTRRPAATSSCSCATVDCWHTTPWPRSSTRPGPATSSRRSSRLVEGHVMNATTDAGNGATCRGPAQARPPDGRADPGRAVRADGLARLDAVGERLRQVRRAPARASSRSSSCS